MAKETYSQKLKDPRWQKKRLEVLQRDGFKCQYCGEEYATLHVHHIKYDSHDPWDTSSAYLITICEFCHQQEHALEREAKDNLILSLRMNKFSVNDLNHLNAGFHKLREHEFKLPAEVIASAIQWALSDKEMSSTIIDKFLKSY